MTEYWVSQGNKWCEHCHIFIANNAASIQMHEYGQRHKDNVTKRLATIRKDAISQEVEKKKAEREMEKIEKAAKRQYEKDCQAARQHEKPPISSPSPPLKPPNSSPSTPLKPVARTDPPREAPKAEASGSTVSGEDWVQEEGSGYYYNAATGYYYDANSGLYYSDIIGRWCTQEESLQASQNSQSLQNSHSSQQNSQNSQISQNPQSSGVISGTSKPKSQTNASQPPTKTLTKPPAKPGTFVSSETSEALPGPVRENLKTPGKVGRGVASSLSVAGFKRKERGSGPVSEGELKAREAREAARRRTEEREKHNLGLYQSF